MRPLFEATARVSGKSFERKYIALGRIVNSWSQIVGADLAHKALPVRILYRKKAAQKSPESTLEIATSSADATLLHYQKDLILERINQIFGERWITAIRFVAVPANTQSLRRKKAQKPLTDHEKKHLSDIVNAIEDPEVKLRLEALGQAILMEETR
jgi:hypothetical protein